MKNTDRYFIVTKIEWDTDDADALSDLPAIVNVSLLIEPDFSEDDIEDYLGDYLADQYGYCVNGFKYAETTEQK